MKIKSLLSIFVFGIGLASLIYSSDLLDFTLVPRFITLAICFVVLFILLFRKKSEIKFELNLSTFIYAAYTVFACSSIFWATTKSESYFESSKLLLFFMCFLFGIYSLKENEEIFYKLIIRLSYIVLLTVAAFVVFQLFKLSSFDKESLYLVTGINGHKNLLSSFLFLNLFFLIRASYPSNGTTRFLPIGLALISLLIIILLKTKAVWLGLSISLFTFILLFFFSKISKKTISRKWIYLLLVIFVVLFNSFFLLFFKPLLQRSLKYTEAIQNGTSIQNQTIKLESERLVLWDKTLDMIQDSPIFGVGMGNWQIHFPNTTLTGLWRAEDLNYTFQRPHNDFLWILSETGLIGFNLFICFLIVLLLFTFQVIQQNRSDFKKQFYFLLSFSFIVGYYFISFFDFPKERIEHSIWINLLLAMLVFGIQKEIALPFKREVLLNKSHLFIGLLLSILVCWVALLRYKGEFYTRKLLDNKNADQKYEVIKCADKILSVAYSIDPTSVPIQWYTGNAQAALGNYNKAKSDFISSYALTPYNRNVLNDLASAHAMGGETELAKKYYEEAARISPRFDDPKLNLAAIYIQENNLEKAGFWLKSILHDSERRSNYESLIELRKKKP